MPRDPSKPPSLDPNDPNYDPFAPQPGDYGIGQAPPDASVGRTGPSDFLGAAGSPVSIFDPTWVGRKAQNDMFHSGWDGLGLDNSAQGRLRAGANASPNANPYSAIVANQARPAQEALYAQMRAQQAGPSVAAMQGQRAQGQNLQAALGAGAGRGAMMQAGAVGGGMAGDVGMARLAEQLRMSQGLGQMTTGVRGADLGVAGAQSQAGLQQRGLDESMRQFYASQGARLDDAARSTALEKQRILSQQEKIRRDEKLKAEKEIKDTAASFLSMGMGAA